MNVRRYSDCVLLFQNEELLKVLSANLTARDSLKLYVVCCDMHLHLHGRDAKGRYRVGVHDINLYIASCLAGVFFPCQSSSSKHSIGFDFGDFVTNVCPMHQSKFVQISAFPFAG